MRDAVWRIAASFLSVVAGAGLGAVLFLSAGTLDWPAAWMWIAVFVLAGIVMALMLDPGLMKERITGVTPKRERTTADWWGIVTALLFMAWLPLMGFDTARYGWTTAPMWTQVVGAVLYIAGNVLVGLTLHANRFASSAVRVQDERGQTVVSSGPYAFVRHPMYSGMLLWLPGTALLLGSVVGLALTVVIVATLALRTWFEDEHLRRELEGYGDYSARVRYRLVPRLW